MLGYDQDVSRHGLVTFFFSPIRRRPSESELDVTQFERMHSSNAHLELMDFLAEFPAVLSLIIPQMRPEYLVDWC